jgi:hypothetical protein
MNRRHLIPFGTALGALSFVLAACGSAAPTNAPSTGAGQSAGPSVALPSLAVPSVVVPSIALPSASAPPVSQPSGSVPPVPPASVALPSDSFALPSDSFALPSGSFALPSFSFPSEDKELENRLPNTINGVTLTKYSFKGSTFLGSGASNSKDLIDLLTSLGKTPDDMSVAFAADPTGDLDLQVGAFKVAGADSNALLAAFVAASKSTTPTDQVTQTNVGGKNVTQIVDPADTTTGAIYVYANGDVLYYVLSPDPALAGAAIQALP